MTYALVQWGNYLFHITHEENVPGILARGVCSKNLAARENISYRSIADEGIQLRRGATDVPIGNRGTLHDYVPLFFGARPTMLYPVRYRVSQSSIFYLIVDWTVLSLDTTVFTDGNASTGGTEYFQGIENLGRVDQTVAGAIWWNTSDEVRRKKAAEVLVWEHLEIDHVKIMAVMNDEAKARAEAMIRARKLDIPVVVAPEFYYR